MSKYNIEILVRKKKNVYANGNLKSVYNGLYQPKVDVDKNYAPVILKPCPPPTPGMAGTFMSVKASGDPGHWVKNTE